MTTTSLVDQAAFLFETDDEFTMDPEDWDDAVAKTERAAEVLDAVAAHLASCAWTTEQTDVRPPIEALGIKPRKAMPLLYTAIEGHRAGLPLFDSIELLGREPRPGPAPGGAPATGLGGRTDHTLRSALPFGGGVIGNTTGSGPVIGGSSPPPEPPKGPDPDRGEGPGGQ